MTRTALRTLPPRPRATASSLEVGEEVYVTNLQETLTCKATSIKVIEPNNINEILFQLEWDMLTLLTCHPIASEGRYRYVVYCDRVAG